MIDIQVFGLNLANVKEFIVAIVGIAGFAFTCFRIGRAFGNRADKISIQKLTQSTTVLMEQVAVFENRFNELKLAANSSQDFWTRPPKPPFDLTVHRGEISGSIPVISIVNFKGGVGKTTICANLAGYFARCGRRVLTIDFDYQGSLSDTLLSHARIEPFASTSQRLIAGRETPEALRPIAERLTPLSSNLWLFPAFYGLSRAEIQVMFRWFAGDDQEVRFNLHRYLRSRPFQGDPESGFDLVLIDCPPRLLTASVNALAASTHVIVPTILDGQSHVATLNTLSAIQQFRQNLNKNLKTLGVVPSLVTNSTGYNEREQQFIEELERQIPKFHDPIPVLKNRQIVRKEPLARAGGSEALYLSSSNDQKTQDIRAMFERLANYISENVEWKQREVSDSADLRGANHDNRRTAART
jgi:chromosome partitioning protein